MKHRFYKVTTIV